MLTLHWENVALLIPIAVDTPAVVSDNLQQQLHNLPGFFWQGFAQAASWSARNNANLDRAATWVGDAIVIFRKNVADHPGSWNAYDSLGEALAQKGQTADAVAQYTKALQMVGDDTNKTRISGILEKLGVAT